MGSHCFRNAWSANAALAVLGLGCIGAGNPGAELEGAQPAVPPAPASVVAEIEPAKVANHPPRFISVAPFHAREGEPYAYRFSALDPDGDELRYVLVRAPEGAALAGEVLEWTPRHGQAGRTQQFTLRAVDEHGAAQDQTWSVIPRPDAEGHHHHRYGHSHRF